MSDRKNQLQDKISGIHASPRDIYEGLCMVAPSPELQQRIKAEFERLGLRPDGEAALTSSAGKAAAKTRSRKASARKGSRKAGAADAAATAAAGADVSELVAGLIRLKHEERMGLNDGLIVPGIYYPVGTPAAVVRSAAADRAPLRGTLRVIVVLVQFSGTAMTRTAQHFRDLFFSTGVLPNGSVKEFYREVSNGLIDIAGDVVGPFTLPNPMSYYAHGASGMGGAAPNARTMASEAAAAANPTVNFAPYDNDGNGYVDAFIVVHAGPGAEVTGNTNHIWSHKWVLPSEYNADGTKIYAYLTVPEDSKIGVCAHELGHLLFGWPDLYDTDYTSSGIGNWCLMSGGSWNGGGDIPAHPSAWCKVNQGWVSVLAPTTNQMASIADVKTSRNVYRLWQNGAPGSEYFLVENRQRTLFDRQLPGDGLLIWHIDESIGSNSNEVHPKVALVQSDGLRQLESGANRGDAGDPFPGSAHNAAFTKTSNPSSKSYAGADTCVAVTNISASGPTISARLGVRCIKLKDKEIFKEVHKEKIETLEKPFRDHKGIFKEVEKPVTDKAAGFDKNPASEKFRDKLRDKLNEKLTEGGGGGFHNQFGAPFPQPDKNYAEAGNAEPYINSELRPDLSQGALLSEEDYNEVQAQMQSGSAEAKRLYDTKPRET